MIYEIEQELNIQHGWNNWIPEEDLTFGIELYSMIHDCSHQLSEAAQLSVFFESLLTKENLNSVLAATMHIIQPNADDNINDFTAINMWYEMLDKRYNLSLGPAILPLMTSDTLERLENLEPPYLKGSKYGNDQGKPCTN